MWWNIEKEEEEAMKAQDKIQTIKQNHKNLIWRREKNMYPHKCKNIMINKLCWS